MESKGPKVFMRYRQISKNFVMFSDPFTLKKFKRRRTSSNKKKYDSSSTVKEGGKDDVKYNEKFRDESPSGNLMKNYDLLKL